MLNRDFAFEILAMTTLLEQSFDEIFYNVSTLVNRNGKMMVAWTEYIDEDENESIMYIFQIKNSKGLQVLVATFQELPEIAKNSKSKLLEEIFEASSDSTNKSPIQPIHIMDILNLQIQDYDLDRQMGIYRKN